MFVNLAAVAGPMVGRPDAMMDVNYKGESHSVLLNNDCWTVVRAVCISLMIWVRWGLSAGRLFVSIFDTLP